MSRVQRRSECHQRSDRQAGERKQNPLQDGTLALRQRTQAHHDQRATVVVRPGRRPAAGARVVDGHADVAHIGGQSAHVEVEGAIGEDQHAGRAIELVAQARRRFETEPNSDSIQLRQGIPRAYVLNTRSPHSVTQVPSGPRAGRKPVPYGGTPVADRWL
jgi:hypothetical protein